MTWPTGCWPLDAAEAEGGDIRGRQSAALLIVLATGLAWRRRSTSGAEDDPGAAARSCAGWWRCARVHRHEVIAARPGG